jgi:hypothetical protein
MSQTPPSYYPPPTRPANKQSWTVVVIVIVVVVIVIGAGIAAYGINQVYRAATTPQQPNIVVTDAHSQESCPAFGNPVGYWTATLINTGASGYANLNFILNGQTITSNTYYVAGGYSLPISESASMTSCPNAATSSFSIIVASQWHA